MKLDNLELITEFHKEIKEDFPDANFEQLKDIVFGPWKFLRSKMESGLFPSIRFTYFGVFKIYPNRVIYLRDNLNERLEKGEISQDFYDTHIGTLNKYIEKNENR